MKKNLFILILTVSCFILSAQKLPLRTEMSLNGTWNFTPKGGEMQTMEVPDYWDAHQGLERVDEAVYQREIWIPDTDEWKNKTIKIEFEGVNFIADVFINNRKVIHHVGGWIPFSADVTAYIKTGQLNKIKVVVKGGNHEPIVDTDLNPVWPVGFFGQYSRWGIVFDVWLRAYGNIHVKDAFIQTSCRRSSLNIDYQLRNDLKKSATIDIQGKVFMAEDPENVVLELHQSKIECLSDTTRSISLEAKWTNPRLWSPDDPYLYYLETSILNAETGELIDRETRRFGFREIWIEGPRMLLNGQRLTILGANLVQHSEFFKDQNYFYLSPESWNRTIDRLFELNLRTVRFHMQPAPHYILDIADERGLLVMDESAIYAREFILQVNKEKYLENCYRWIESWVKDRRNHPSVIVWNAENEMGVGWLNWMTPEEIKSLGDCIRKYDDTRPVNYDGDRDVGDQMVNLHYPEVYKGTVEGSIYAWADSLHPEKPTGIGEFITHYGENGLKNQWLMGTFVRGLRYTYYSDIRPYRHDWALLRENDTECTDNLKRSLSPVALFDKQYDDLGLDPLLYKNYPVMYTGDTLERELVLYNDEFSDTVITVEVLVRSTETHQALYNYNGDKSPVTRVIAQDRKTYIVPLGEHVDIPYRLIVPNFYEGFLDRVEIDLIARKKGEVKFKETLKFALRAKSRMEARRETSPKIELFESENPDIKER